jgi:hypothetical protein
MSPQKGGGERTSEAVVRLRARGKHYSGTGVLYMTSNDAANRFGGPLHEWD